MANFTVRGPFDVPVTTKKAGRIITKADISSFWDARPGIAKTRGCYVFAFRASKGLKPIYVGKATKTFSQEVFTDHKVRNYNDALADQVKGTPVLFFVALTTTKGPTNKTAIDDAESYLIQLGLAANKELANDRKVKVPSWSIQGVVRSSKGAVSKSAQELKRCLSMN